jgi:hypothetical protein
VGFFEKGIFVVVAVVVVVQTDDDVFFMMMLFLAFFHELKFFFDPWTMILKICSVFTYWIFIVFFAIVFCWCTWREIQKTFIIHY